MRKTNNTSQEGVQECLYQGVRNVCFSENFAFAVKMIDPLCLFRAIPIPSSIFTWNCVGA